MITDNVHDTGTYYTIKLPVTKTGITRTFVVEGKFYDIVKKYMNLRPKNVTTKKFFINYQHGKCTNQIIGINKLGAMPKMIANYLNLPDAESYTGHCFRRTSATVLADSGADLVTLKRHGGWKSNGVAEGYIENSIQNKRNIGKRIANSILKLSTVANSISKTQPTSEKGN